jgi:hypothetical protein
MVPNQKLNNPNHAFCLQAYRRVLFLALAGTHPLSNYKVNPIEEENIHSTSHRGDGIAQHFRIGR